MNSPEHATGVHIRLVRVNSSMKLFATGVHIAYCIYCILHIFVFVYIHIRLVRVNSSMKLFAPFVTVVFGLTNSSVARNENSDIRLPFGSIYKIILICESTNNRRLCFIGLKYL